MWIELHSGAPRHPKILRVADDLGISRIAAVGHLVALWTWCLDLAPDGDLSTFTGRDIEIACDWTGERGRFVESLICNRLLDDLDGDGKRLVVHDWRHYSGSLKAAERKRKERGRGTVTRPSRDRDETVPRGSRDVTQTDQNDQNDRPTDTTDNTRRDSPATVTGHANEKGARVFAGDQKQLRNSPDPASPATNAARVEAAVAAAGWAVQLSPRHLGQLNAVAALDDAHIAAAIAAAARAVPEDAPARRVAYAVAIAVAPPEAPRSAGNGRGKTGRIEVPDEEWRRMSPDERIALEKAPSIPEEMARFTRLRAERQAREARQRGEGGTAA